MEKKMAEKCDLEAPGSTWAFGLSNLASRHCSHEPGLRLSTEPSGNCKSLSDCKCINIFNWLAQIRVRDFILALLAQCLAWAGCSACPGADFRPSRRKTEGSLYCWYSAQRLLFSNTFQLKMQVFRPSTPGLNRIMVQGLAGTRLYSNRVHLVCGQVVQVITCTLPTVWVMINLKWDSSPLQLLKSLSPTLCWTCQWNKGAVQESHQLCTNHYCLWHCRKIWVSS
jgi:hypothetical protein